MKRLTLEGGRISPDLLEVTQLKSLVVCNGMWNAVPELEALSFLESLKIDCSSSLTTFPDLSRLTRLKSLFVTANSVTALHDGISGLGMLEVARLDMTGLERLGHGFGALQSLRELRLSLGPSTPFDSVIGKLARLERLSVGLGGFQSTRDAPSIELPESIAGLAALKELRIARNMPKVSPLLFELKTLEALSLRGICVLPDEIEKLSSLRELDVSQCGLTQLPEVLGRCASLTALEVGWNELTEVPASVVALPRLETLDLRYNSKLTRLPALPAGNRLRTLLVNGPLIALPDGIGECAALEKLELCSTKLTRVPDALVELPALKEVTLLYNYELVEAPVFAASVKLQTSGNAYQRVNEPEDEERSFVDSSDIAHHPRAKRWIHGLRIDGEVLTLDVETIVNADDYPDSQREAWTLDLTSGALSFDRVTSELAMNYDCGYRREHFQNSLAAADEGDPAATRVSLYLHGERRKASIILPGDEECLESPVGQLVRRHSYRSDAIDRLAVSEDEIYMTAKLSWIEHVYLVLLGSAGGRVWRVLARREHEALGSLAYYRGNVLVGSNKRIHRVTSAGVEPYIQGVDASLMLVDGDRLIFGGGRSCAVFTADGSHVTKGFGLNFVKDRSKARAPHVVQDERWARAELKNAGLLPAVDETLAPLDERTAAERTDDWRSAIALCDARDFAGARRHTAALAAAHPSPLVFRLHAFVCARCGAIDDALLACDSYLRARPLEIAVHALKASLLEGRAGEEAARLMMYDVQEHVRTQLFAESWLSKGANTKNVEFRLQEALAVLPDAAPLLRSMAQFLLLEGRFDEAEAHAAKADTLLPDPDRTTHLRAMVAQRRGDGGESAAALRTALRRLSAARAHGGIQLRALLLWSRSPSDHRSDDADPHELA